MVLCALVVPRLCGDDWKEVPQAGVNERRTRMTPLGIRPRGLVLSVGAHARMDGRGPAWCCVNSNGEASRCDRRCDGADRGRTRNLLLAEQWLSH